MSNPYRYTRQKRLAASTAGRASMHALRQLLRAAGSRGAVPLTGARAVEVRAESAVAGARFAPGRPALRASPEDSGAPAFLNAAGAQVRRASRVRSAIAASMILLSLEPDGGFRGSRHSGAPAPSSGDIDDSEESGPLRAHAVEGRGRSSRKENHARGTPEGR